MEYNLNNENEVSEKATETIKKEEKPQVYTGEAVFKGL